MKLETVATEAMIGAIDTLLTSPTQGMIDFYTSANQLPDVTGTLSGTGLLNTGTRLRLYTAQAMEFITGTLGTFSDIAADTVAAAGSNIVAYFAMFNTTATDATTGEVVLTGTVDTANADITFNTTRWDNFDNVSITSLTWQQPQA